MYIAVLGIIIITILYCAPIVVESKRSVDRLPKAKTKEARIIDKSNVVQLVPGEGDTSSECRGSKAGYRNRIDFELVNGEIVTLKVSPREYKEMKVGDWGLLTYKNGSVKRFVKGVDDTYVHHSA